MRASAHFSVIVVARVLLLEAFQGDDAIRLKWGWWLTWHKEREEYQEGCFPMSFSTTIDTCRRPI